MSKLLRHWIWGQIWRDESGQDLIEYALLAAMMVFAAVASMNVLANHINNAFAPLGSELDSAI